METTEFIFTPENLLENLDKLGPWSEYYLASLALQHYFPEEYILEGNPSTQKELDLVIKLGFQYWGEVVEKYHKEVGYDGPFNPDYVNER